MKQEWCTTWTSFIPEICTLSRTDQNLCESLVNILKQLSEEIFDFSKMSITSEKARNLKATMTKEFGAVFDLCGFIIDTFIADQKSIKSSLIKVTLKTLGAFMSWIPLGYIFETSMIIKLIDTFLSQNIYRVETIKCLTEIAGLRVAGGFKREYEEAGLIMFIKSMEKMEQIIGTTSLSEEYPRVPMKQKSGFESFCQQFALLLNTFMTHHIDLVESALTSPAANPDFQQALAGRSRQCFNYLLQLSSIPTEEVFKICCEFWNFLTTHVFNQVANEAAMSYNAHQAPRKLINKSFYKEVLNLEPKAKNPLIQSISTEVFPQIMTNHVAKMPKPKEVNFPR